MRHPGDTLFPGETPFPILPAVDHYAGSEKLTKKALQLQIELGPILDITCDCEDRAHAGAELKDLDVMRNDARRARNEFGYLRMWSIHPNQIMPIVEAMCPDFSEVETATDILIAAQDKDWAPIAHQGRLHDRASHRYCWELLARAHATGMALPADAQQRFFG